MKRRIGLWVAMLLVAACGGEGATEAAVVAGPPLVLERIDFEAGEVVIRNTGADPYDLTGHALCNRPNYLTIPAQTLGPGDTVTVDASSLGLSAGGGEVGLYSASSFGDAGAMLGYVQWGSDNHGRTEVAVEAGLWAPGDFVAGGGSSIVSRGDAPASAADWSAG